MKLFTKWNIWLEDDFGEDSVVGKVFLTLMMLIVGVPLCFGALLLMTIWQVDVILIGFSALIYTLVKLFQKAENNENKARKYL